MDSRAISGDFNSDTSFKSNQFRGTVERSQNKIYRFFINLVQHVSSEQVLTEFKSLFFEYQKTSANASVLSALTHLIFENEEQAFVYTLKRSCYILINNWEAERHHEAVKSLVETLAQLNLTHHHTSSHILLRLRTWLKNFLESKDYREIQIFIAKSDQTSPQQVWSQRYLSYLLVPQYSDSHNSQEQRQAAQILSQQLKEKFKFELAMYTARSHPSEHPEETPENPTSLGEDTLRLIKKIVAKQGSFSYGNIAHIFLKQNNKINYQYLKSNLQKYLVFSLKKLDSISLLKEKLEQKITPLYQERDHDISDESLILRTCNRVCDYLTTEDGEEPSEIFILLMSQGNSLTLVILLLKVILISPNSRVHLETRIAELVQYYMQYPESECQWVVKFFEIFKVTFTIYADNDVQYNLIRMDEDIPENSSEEALLDTYRIFSQRREEHSSQYYVTKNESGT